MPIADMRKQVSLHCGLILCLSGLSLGGVSPVHGQVAEVPSDSGPRFWLHAGPAWTTLGTGEAAGILVEFNRNTLGLRTANTGARFGDEMWDIAVLYGRAGRISTFEIAGSVGASVTGGRRRAGFFGGVYGTRIEPTLGFPIEGQLRWHALPFAGVGVYAFGNINTEQPFGGIGISLHVGSVR